MPFFNYTRLTTQSPFFPSHNAYSYVDGDFKIKLSFNWTNTVQEVNEIKYEIINKIKPENYLFKFNNITICKKRLNGADNLLFLMINFDKVGKKEDATQELEDTFSPSFRLKMEKGTVLFVKFNLFGLGEDPTKSCENIPVFSENPDTKNGAIIVGI